MKNKICYSIANLNPSINLDSVNVIDIWGNSDLIKPSGKYRFTLSGDMHIELIGKVKLKEGWPFFKKTVLKDVGKFWVDEDCIIFFEEYNCKEEEENEG